MSFSYYSSKVGATLVSGPARSLLPSLSLAFRRNRVAKDQRDLRDQKKKKKFCLQGLGHKDRRAGCRLTTLGLLSLGPQRVSESILSPPVYQALDLEAQSMQPPAEGPHRRWLLRGKPVATEEQWMGWKNREEMVGIQAAGAVSPFCHIY